MNKTTINPVFPNKFENKSISKWKTGPVHITNNNQITNQWVPTIRYIGAHCKFIVLDNIFKIFYNYIWKFKLIVLYGIANVQIRKIYNFIKKKK